MNAGVCYFEPDDRRSQEGGGGTGQAIRIAKALDIPVLDMGILSFDSIEKRITALI